MIMEAIIFMVALALVLGIILAYASKRFEVKKSEIASKILAVLPGINCGACGYAGCEAYAKAIEKGAAIDLCIPGKQEVKDKIAAILAAEKNNNSQPSNDSVSDITKK